MRRYLNYHFENIITKSSNFVYFLLIMASLSALLMLGLQLAFGLLGEDTFFNHWWNSLTKIINVGGGGTLKERIINFMFWGLKVAISGTIIAFLTAKVSTFINNLNRGESFVIDKNHYIIIGWNSNIYKIFKEIETANLNQSKPTILCFNGMNNVEMRTKIDIEYPNQKNLRIVTRTGDTYSMLDLERTNASEARSVIILDDNLKKGFNIETTILAIRRILKNSSIKIIAQFENADNIPILSDLMGNQILPIHKNKVIANLTAQSIRSSLIQAVVMDFMDYDGDEIYFFPSEKLIGISFKQAMLFLQNITIIGVLKSDGKVYLNPDKNYIITKNDELVVIAEDDTNLLDFKEDAAIYQKMNKISNQPKSKIIFTKETKSILILGWSELGQQIIQSAIPFLDENSTLNFIYNESLVKSEPKIEDYNIKTSIIKCPDNDQECIGKYLKEATYDIILILGYDDMYSQEVADTFAMMRNLYVKSILKQNESTENTRIVLHLNDGSKKNLISVETEIETESEFIVSDVLSSLLITQLADNPRLWSIFEELFSDSGLKINLKPLPDSQLFKAHESIIVEDLILTTIENDETFIGYVLNDKLFLNPPKKSSIINNSSLLVIVIS